MRQTKITFSQVDNAKKYVTSKSEAVLALLVAEHTSFLATDHIVEAGKKAFKDSKQVSYVKLHRTKCKEMLVNVLDPHLFSAYEKILEMLSLT